ncbi:DinB family protein [Mucilaginibacter sp. Bleaf8]|uniref:DinB family protein n=1 Tax=Mucilaginibacter sp. Bleaf8 TaxID=2834430 RepID=UPI001BCBC156|nr:DinB family protein [Mucilaginibacter sp. Bleaf8]MBS7566586.1 DinB family protein [Mucilaginibacter sp. Bleaf8]
MEKRIAAEHKAINAALDIYRERLENISEERFTETPPGGGWSYAEVYSHILQANLGSSIAAEKCCNKTATSTDKGLNWKGRLVFLLGQITPGRHQAPPQAAALAKKISKEEARNLIVRLRKRVDELAPQICKASADYKVNHPGLGMLNAVQWLKFIRMHTVHHLKQLDRIEKSFPQQ